MPRLVDQLADVRSEFVKYASEAMASGERLRLTVEGEVGHFFNALLASLENGDQDGLDGLLQSWVQARPSYAPEEKVIGLLPVLHTLRACLFRALRHRLAPDDALQLIVTVDPVFASAGLRLAGLELEAVRTDVEARLAEARLNLERLDKSKSDFISVAAHELKTPLTLIEGYANMLGAEFPAEQHPRAQVMLGGVANGTRRLREIIDDMIDVSMIDNDLMSLNFQPVWIHSLLAQCRNEAQKSLEERQQTMRVQGFPGWEQMTYADPERLLQVFMNVLRNAIKYTPDQGSITVSGRVLSGFIEITIADTGIGIAPENQQRIFEKFGSVGNVALHSSGKTKFKGGGPGLGLPIAKGVIEAHGGAIWCESPGYDDRQFPGSTFHIMIPLRDAPPKDNTPKLFGLTDEEAGQIAELNAWPPTSPKE